MNKHGQHISHKNPYMVSGLGRPCCEQINVEIKSSWRFGLQEKIQCVRLLFVLQHSSFLLSNVSLSTTFCKYGKHAMTEGSWKASTADDHVLSALFMSFVDVQKLWHLTATQHQKQVVLNTLSTCFSSHSVMSFSTR